MFGEKRRKSKKEKAAEVAATQDAGTVDAVASVPGEEPEAPAAPVRLTLKELRSMDLILGERADGDLTHVVTKGGRKLTFPGDEEKAAALPPEELDGVSRKGWPSANVFGK